MSEVNIMAEQKPKSIKLADGKEYLLPPIDLTTLANVEKAMGFSLNKLSEKMDTEMIQTLRLLVYGLLHELQPELTLDQVGRLVTPAVMKEMADTIGSVLSMSS